ncbi:armadillo-type protein [Chiua virens]|nr:armadillo-type protein [Chiua virens]
MPAVQKNAKKRPTSSQDGPKAKRPHISKQATAKHGDDDVKKRRQPVTLPIKEVNEEDSDDESGDIASGEDDDEVNSEKDEMAVEDGVPKDPNGRPLGNHTKLSACYMNNERLQSLTSQLITDAKRVWSLARQKNLSSTDRQKHVRDLMNIVTGKVKDIVFKHDASRIIQTIVKYGGQRERDQVAGELKGHYKGLAKSKYSKFLVTKLIRFCPVHRVSILSEFRSHVLKLLLHREASGVLADAFELYANAYERSILLQDFYGKEAALFTSNRGTAQDIETARKGLRGLLDGVEGARRKRLLAALKENLTTIFNNPDKGAITHAIVHRALWEFLTAVDNAEESEQEKLRREIFESCQDVLAEMVHTKDGSRVVRDFIAYGTAKDRKHIIKVIKPHVERMCTDDEAQLVLFTALDMIDDTKLTAKSLVSDITTHTSSLATSPQGRRSLFHLIVPRSRRHFTPAQIAVIAETDHVRAKTSKKDNAGQRERDSESRQRGTPSVRGRERRRNGERYRWKLARAGDHALCRRRQGIRDDHLRRGACIPLPIGRSLTTASDRSSARFSHVQKLSPRRPFLSFGTICDSLACVLAVGIRISLSLGRWQGDHDRDRAG